MLHVPLMFRWTLGSKCGACPIQLVSFPAGLLWKFDTLRVLLNFSLRNALVAAKLATANNNAIAVCLQHDIDQQRHMLGSL